MDLETSAWQAIERAATVADFLSTAGDAAKDPMLDSYCHTAQTKEYDWMAVRNFRPVPPSSPTGALLW